MSVRADRSLSFSAISAGMYRPSCRPVRCAMCSLYNV
jgi:hypothetical protein